MFSTKGGRGGVGPLVENSTNFFFLKPSLSQKELGSIYGVKIVMSVYYSYKKVIIICMKG